MSDLHQTPHLRLQVDQEVFIDSIREGDTIDDATVATEVTSFDRVGDAYVLEGAIVFSGYLKRERAKQHTQPVEADDVLSLGTDGEYVEHVHHRMPFLLRVPVKAQPRGIVNVASRIASWRLEVLGAGWVRVVADLHIVGLNGQQAYHFQCGAQEEGDLFFDSDDRPVDTNLETDNQPRVEESLALVRGKQEDDVGEAFDRGDVPGNIEPTEAQAKRMSDISLARSGQGAEPNDQDTGAAAATPEQVDGDTRTFLGEASTRNVQEELSGYDRLVTGDSPHDNRSPVPPQQVDHSSPLAEFEFVHQPSSHERTGGTDQPDEAQSPALRGGGGEEWKQASGFTPTIQMNAQSPDESFVQVDGPDADGERSEKGVIDARMWSFVDFNGPEQHCTLRYVVVMDEETLDSVAERVGCSKSEIMRANRLFAEDLRAGQTLLIPAMAKHV